MKLITFSAPMCKTEKTKLSPAPSSSYSWMSLPVYLLVSLPVYHLSVYCLLICLPIREVGRDVKVGDGVNRKER